jgi:hypothetical protein
MHTGPGSAALKILFIEESDAEVLRLRTHLESLGYSIHARRVCGEQALSEALACGRASAQRPQHPFRCHFKSV